MKIPTKLLDKWGALKSEGDIQKIADNANVTRQTIRNAFKNNECSDDVFKAIADFYEEKLEMIKEYM